MNVNVKLSLTDEERNTMYRNITGKDVKKMVSRKDVSEFVAGAIASVLVEGDEEQDTCDQTVPVSQLLTPSEVRIVERLSAEGKSESYIRGFIKGGRPGNRT